MTARRPIARREPGHDLPGRSRRGDRVEVADGDERGAVDPGELVDGVERLHPGHAGRVHGWVRQPPRELVGIRDVRPERGEDPVPVLVAHWVAAVVASGQRGHLVAGDRTEAIDDPSQVEPGPRRLEHETARVARMTGAVQHRDEATHRVAQDDRPGDADGVAECPHVVRAGFEGPRVRVVPGRAAMVPQVQVDHLRDGREPAEVGLEVRVVVSARVRHGRARPSGGHASIGPFGTSAAPSTSNQSRVPFTSTCIAR